MDITAVWRENKFKRYMMILGLKRTEDNEEGFFIQRDDDKDTGAIHTELEEGKIT